MVSQWSLSDSKSPQVSRTLLSIPPALNNAVVWMVSTCSLIFKSFSPFTNPLGIVPSAPTTIGITVTLMLHSCCFFQFSSEVYIFISLFAFFYFPSFVCWDGSLLFGKFSFWLLLTITRSGRLAEIRWSSCLSKSQRIIIIIIIVTH